MKIPPLEWPDLIAFGLSPSASISTDTGITPTPHWLAAKVYALALLAPPNDADKLSYLRQVRDLVMNATDWTQASDSPFSSEQRAAWAAYRQALRDLPRQYSGAGPIPWPSLP